jgi:hypothetical protein
MPLPVIGNSNSTVRCGMNVTGFASSYPYSRIADTPIITDLSIIIADHPAGTPPGSTQYNTVLNGLQSANADCVIGRYMSGRRVQASHLQYPAECVLTANIPSQYIRDTDSVDLDQSAARTEFVSEIMLLHTANPRPVIFLDNVIHPSVLQGWCTWTNTCAFLAALKTELNAVDTLLIPNIAIHLPSMTQSEADLLSQSVDGMTFEQPYHTLARASLESTEKITGYFRQWASAGKVVVFIDVAPDGIDAEQNAQFLAAYATAIREPGDKLFVTRSFFKTDAIWNDWPNDVGAASGSYTFRKINYFNNSAYGERQFQNAKICFNAAASRGYKPTTYTPAHAGAGNDCRQAIIDTLALMVFGDVIRFRNTANGGSDEWLVSSPVTFSDTDLSSNPGGIEVNVSGVTIQLDPSVIVYAMADYYHGKFQSLCRLKEITDVDFVWGANSAFKMRKSIYAATPFDPQTGLNANGYTQSEHRHGLSIIQCQRITGLGSANYHLIDSGGDGLHICGKEDTGQNALRTKSTEVILTDVGMDNNHRQGMSVVCVDGLRCDRCDFDGTIGTQPQSGHDFEPDHPRDVLKRIVLSNCSGYNNQSRNSVINLYRLDCRTVPPAWYHSDDVDIEIRQGEYGGNGSRNPWGMHVQNSILGPDGGIVRYVGVRISAIKNIGLYIDWRVDSNWKLIFDDCILDNASSDNLFSPIKIVLYGEGVGSATGGIFFNRLFVREQFDRPIFDIQHDATTRPSGGKANCIHGIVLLDPNGITPTVNQIVGNYPNLCTRISRKGIDTKYRRMSAV